MTQFKFLITALSTVSIAGSIILGSTSAEACLYNKLKSGSSSFNSTDKVAFNWKNLLTSQEIAKAAGIAAATGTAGFLALGLFYYRRRDAKLASRSFESFAEVSDPVKLHPEAPSSELEIQDDATISGAESSQKEVVLMK